MSAEKWVEIVQDIHELITKIIADTKKSLEKLKLNNWILSDLFWLKKESNKNNNEWKETNWEKKEEKKEEGKETKINDERLKSFFEKNANDLSINIIDGKEFFEISYTDKSSGSKVKGIIPFTWNWDSNIYMPGDRSGIEETMKQKNFKEMITKKNSKKARFIFEWDADKIQNWTQQSARYNNVIKNFENMVSPMKSAGNNPKINIIWHSRAGKTVDSLIWKYWFINSYIIIDWTYWVYNNVINTNIPGKIFYTNVGGTKKYIDNYKNKEDIQVIHDSTSNHEQVVAQALNTDQELFA